MSKKKNTVYLFHPRRRLIVLPLEHKICISFSKTDNLPNVVYNTKLSKSFGNMIREVRRVIDVLTYLRIFYTDN